MGIANGRYGAGRAVPNAKLSNGEGSFPAVRAGGPRYRSFGMGCPMYRARAAAALPEACRHVPYIVLRLSTLAPGSLRENNEQ